MRVCLLCSTEERPARGAVAMVCVRVCQTGLSEGGVSGGARVSAGGGGVATRVRASLGGCGWMARKVERATV